MEELGDTCRLCGSELQGNQRRWLFHRDPRPPDLRLLLAHVLGREPPRRGDGRGEFLCGKCAQALGRLFRFDAVIARVQALSLERLRRLLVEKERLARCLRHLHARRGPDAGLAPGAQPPDPSYQRLLQEELALSGLECWAEGGGPGAGSPPCQNRWCHGCHGLRVADSDYEWVCRTPRRLGAGSPTLPLCRDKSQSMPLVLGAGAGGHRGSRLSLRSGSLGTASSCSLLSLDALAGPETLGQALRALRGVGRRALRAPRGSRIPVLAGRAAPPALPREMEEDAEEDEDLGDEFLPLGVKVRREMRERTQASGLPAPPAPRSHH
ncbi:doublesex- and mab-3-related transcription factor A2-like [Emydura macquarii macquarii]|uniref:doublesex- and mab-3-related transcription factor A2-like n=1 Tax=Emydura macquarii macquarii TaxID=1129001 RepID=UPI00352A1BB9